MKEQCRMTMLHNDMNLGRLIVYNQSIVESKLRRRTKFFKRGRSNEPNQLRFKNTEPNQDIFNASKVNNEGLVDLIFLSLLSLLVERSTLRSV